ncbi:TetR/AcrR family transcriptional regulator [Actinocorallia populi]|uniref:TetR/AcrR family transcriptional regulator n=1 Tax=Actinocorallia populi TaxID=2079200 RepID=UPI001E4EE953|nr:TetR/AcrR family transcriptional regulator [Actinocorallia populi]
MSQPDATATTKPGPATRRRMTPGQRRAHLIDVALRVFAEKGYRDTSMGDIARAAGVNRSIVYDRFPTKRALFLNLLQEQHIAALTAMGAPVSACTGREARLRSVVRGYLEFAERHPAARRLLFDFSAEDDPEIKVARWGVSESRTRVLTLLLGEDLRVLGLDPASPDAALHVEILLSGLDGLAQWWDRNPAVPRDELVETALRVFWTGLAHDDGSGRPVTGPERGRRSRG